MTINEWVGDREGGKQQTGRRVGRKVGSVWHFNYLFHLVAVKVS